VVKPACCRRRCRDGRQSRHAAWRASAAFLALAVPPLDALVIGRSAPGWRGGWDRVLGRLQHCDESTNTLEFCISCHEMKDTVYEEYRRSTQLQQPFRCARDLLGLPRAKVLGCQGRAQGSGDQRALPYAVGHHRYAEKFGGQARRARAACLDGMKANDSRECRNCHGYDAMDFHKQNPRAPGKDGAGGSEGRDLHRLPQGRRPQAPTAR